MIIIDTNVISEMMREHGDAAVSSWIDSVGRLHTTAVTHAEVSYGIARLPDGARKDRLAVAAAAIFSAFSDLILPFDQHAAPRYATLTAHRESIGRPIGVADAQIASICALWGATLATRNVTDFEDTGIRLVDPWRQ